MPGPEPEAQLDGMAEALGLRLEPLVRSRLVRYLVLLERWNRTFNLTALDDRSQMLTLHLADCLAVVPPLQRHLAGRDAAVLDVGSGAGLPGVVIALLCPRLKVTCVDAVAKKAAFVRQVAAELGLENLASLHARVEHLQASYEIVISRAFASLHDFCHLTRERVAPGGVWVAMKGKLRAEELSQLAPDVQVFHVEPLQVPGLNAERHLVWMHRGRLTILN